MKSTKSKIALNTLLQLGEKFLAYGVSFITIILIAHYFKLFGYGEYSTANNYVAFFALFADWGIGIIVGKELIKKNQSDRVAFIGNVLLFRLTISIILYGLAFIILIFSNYNGITKQGVVILLFSQIITSFIQVYINISQVYLNTIGVSIAEVASKLVSLILIIGIITLKLNLQATFIAMLISSAVFACISHIFVKNMIPLTFKFDKGIWKELFFLSIPIGLTSLLATVYFKVDSLILSFFKSSIDVAIYSLPYKLLEVILIVPGIFMGLIMPQCAKYFHEHQYDKLKDITQRALEFSCLLSLPMTIGIIMNAGKIIQIIGGDSFREIIHLSFLGMHIQANATLTLQLLSITIFFSYITTVFGYLLIAINGQNKAFIRSLLLAAFNIVLNIIFIPKLTFIGASIITVLSEILGLAFSYFFVYQILHMHFHIPHLFKIISASILIILTSLLLKQFNIFVIITASTCVYLITIILLKIITKEEIFEILGRS